MNWELLLLAIVAFSTAASTAIIICNQYRSWKRQTKLEQLERLMRADARERVEFVNVYRDKDSVVKMRIFNRSRFDVSLTHPTVEVQGTCYSIRGKMTLNAGKDEIFEGDFPGLDLEGLCAHEFKIFDTGDTNKV